MRIIVAKLISENVYKYTMSLICDFKKKGGEPMDNSCNARDLLYEVRNKLGGLTAILMTISDALGNQWNHVNADHIVITLDILINDLEYIQFALDMVWDYLEED